MEGVTENPADGCGARASGAGAAPDKEEQEGTA
ncbi:hypothetical protein HNQ70_002086 [Quisquiliibacterium transsilvanicum]|uniref:Uncharacterized protein n=1 Tax=Quisquiliibacterium transsilvanicum TaxID=1549638 RepID=A0A7W8HHC5_9BURK|nr:hypothetical protein [Quisquiliibacterium transsilvanicum]